MARAFIPENQQTSRRFVVLVVGATRRIHFTRPARSAFVRVDLLFALGIALLVLLAVGGWVSFREVERTSLLRIRTYQVLLKIGDVREALLAVETGARGFSLSGRPEFLEPYESGREAISPALGQVRAMTVDDLAQQSRLAALENLVAKRLAHAEKLVQTRRTEGVAAVEKLSAEGSGQRIMDAAREVLAQMDAEEQRELARHEEASTRADPLAMAVSIAGWVMAIALFVAAFLSFRRENRWRAEAETCLQQSNADLASRVEARTADHTRSEEALRQSIERLAGIVNSAMDAIISIDAGQRVVLFNAAAEQMFGYREVEMIGQPLDRLLPARFRPGSAQDIEGFARSSVTSGKLGTPGAISGVRASGEEFPIEASISQVEVAGEKLCTVILRDITERRQAEGVLRELPLRLLKAEDEERRRIAKELHDSTAQDLVAVMMNLELLREDPGSRDKKADEMLADCLALLENSASDIRKLSYIIHPPRLDETGLAGALVEYAAGFSRRADVRVRVECVRDFARLPEDVELALFRVVQEGLANVLRHSGSDTATVRLAIADRRIVLEVIDQGRGLPPEMLSGSPGARGVGIAAMRERVQHFRGTFELVSSELGTTVRAVLPLPEDTK